MCITKAAEEFTHVTQHESRSRTNAHAAAGAHVRARARAHLLARHRLPELVKQQGRQGVVDVKGARDAHVWDKALAEADRRRQETFRLWGLPAAWGILVCSQPRL